MKWWMRRIVDAPGRAADWFLYRLHPKRRYHVINTGLRPGWHDEDTMILHGCMAMLRRYIEWHGGPDELDAFSLELRSSPEKWGGPEGAMDGQAHQQEEATAIWRWWTGTKPTDEKRRDELTNELFGKHGVKDEAKLKELDALEEKINSEEQTYLHRLIDIRPSLWT